jgi:Kef-type K+ transport system membrane component KefB
MSGLLAAAAASTADTPALIVIDIAIIIVLARLMGALFQRFGQPAVIGEIITGIILGATVLGAFPGHLDGVLFPATALPTLQVLAQLGVILFMFIVGLEVDLGLMRGRRRVASLVSLASVALPFALGAGLAVLIYSRYVGALAPHVSKLAFVLFVGASMSVTAFPVLARILSERKMMSTDLGTFALSCAAVDDVAAWTILAIVVSLVRAHDPLSQLPVMLLELALFVAGSILIVRPAMRWIMERERGREAGSGTLLAVVLVGLLVSAWITDRIGIHLIFGAFIFGAVIPKDGFRDVLAGIVDRIESVTLLLLLPLFFVVAGLTVNIRDIGLQGLGDLLLILAVAIGGKFAGASIAARLQGITARRSMAIGTLMNTRGLTELIILTVGLNLGVIPPRLFTLLVIMAIVTTLLTGPLFRLVYPDRMLQADIAEEQRKLSEGVEYSVLVVLDDGAEAEALLNFGADLAGTGGEVLLVRFLARSENRGPYSGVSGDIIRMTAAMEELNGLAKLRSDIPVRPISQFSADPEGDLAELATRAEADVIVLSAPIEDGQDRIALLGRAGECDVVTIRAGDRPSSGSVVIVVDHQPNAEAALELGGRIAVHRFQRILLAGSTTETLRLLPMTRSEEGRCRRVGDRLRSLQIVESVVVTDGCDLDMRIDTGAALPTLVAGSPENKESNTGLPDVCSQWRGVLAMVHGYDDPQRVGLDQRMQRLSRAGHLAAARPVATREQGA